MSRIKMSICVGLLLVSSVLSALSVNLPPKISLRIPPESAVEGQKITLLITIVHNPSDVIEGDSFMMDEEKLQTQAIQEEKVAPEGLFERGEDGLAVHRFRAILSPRSAGIYSVGPVSVRIAGIRYKSGAVSLHVQEALSTDDFQLEVSLKGPSKIYPGQEILFEYRISFSEPMKVFKEDLPLLNVKGFLSVGSVRVSEERAGGKNIQVISQLSRAQGPMNTTVGRSLIEGMRVRGEGKSTIPPLMRAEAPPVQLEVLPFPEKGRPPHFTGALGSFTWRVSPLDETEVAIGQKVSIEYRVSGRGVLSSVQFPSLDKLSGLKEAFSTDGLPPVGQTDNGTKRFVLEVRPRRAGEKVHVPGFVFASFDPVSERYLSTTIPPVVLHVSGVKAADGEKTDVLAPGVLAPPFDLETSRDYRFSLFWVFFALVVAVAVCVAQWLLHKWYIVNRKEKPETSRDLFYRAMMRRSKRIESLQLLKKALYLRLFELRLTPTLLEMPEGIRDEGVLSDVRGLLQRVDKELYQQERGNLSEILDEASILYHKLQQLRREQ